MQAGEDAADGRAAQGRGLSDAYASPAFAAQHFHAGGQLGGSRAERAMRSRGAIMQAAEPPSQKRGPTWRRTAS